MYKYMLRLTIEPGFREEEKLQTLLDYCRNAKIDDVMFFILGEELNNGHATRDEAKPWVDFIARAKTELALIGVTTSLNPWIILMQVDRGRVLKPGQNFRLMVDPYGQKASSHVCPLDTNWREYFCDLYAYYAQSIEPYVIWIEDDFRLHNHGPLKWGGCFCDEHMARFSEQAGRTLTREEFVEGLLRPGEPHPFRKIWLDNARETMIDLAREVGKAVHSVSPSTHVGLMSSVPEVHCAEGRDWDAVLLGFAGPDLPPVCRPHLQAYEGYKEPTPPQYMIAFREITSLTQHVSPEVTEFYPELEAAPYTRFSRSHAFFRLQLETSAAIGSKGITLNIYDMIGSGIMLSEGYQNVLADSKAFLDELTRLELTKSKQTGVRVLVNTKSSYTLQTPHGQNMEELYPSETSWAALLSVLGIANTYAVDTIPSGEVVAVSGQYFRNLSKNDLKRLFDENIVLLDAEAAHTLYDLGCGELAGIQSARLEDAVSGRGSYEQVCDGKTYAGIPEVRISAQKGGGVWADIDYAPGASVKTVIKSPTGETVAPGVTVWNNKAVILPYRRNLRQIDYHPMRQEMLQSIFTELLGDKSPFFAKGVPYVHVFSYDLGERTALLIVNSSLDEISDLHIHAPLLDIAGAEEISRKSGRGSANITRDGQDIVLHSALAALETRALIL